MPDEPESARVADMLAARTREHRKRLGLSREELAARCDLGDGFGLLDQERVDRILAARSIGELDDLVENGALCFGALFNGVDRLVPRDDWKEIEAQCIAHYASLAARERRRR